MGSLVSWPDLGRHRRPPDPLPAPLTRLRRSITLRLKWLHPPREFPPRAAIIIADRRAKWVCGDLPAGCCHFQGPSVLWDLPAESQSFSFSKTKAHIISCLGKITGQPKASSVIWHFSITRPVYVHFEGKKKKWDGAGSLRKVSAPKGFTQTQLSPTGTQPSLVLICAHTVAYVSSF